LSASDLSIIAAGATTGRPLQHRGTRLQIVTLDGTISGITTPEPALPEAFRIGP
jgi:hypothetical protein